MRRTSCWLSLILMALVLGILSGQESDRPKKYALLVGVNKYNHAEMNRPQALKFAEADVRDLGKLLKESGYECDILTGADASREAILKKLDLLQNKGNSDGVVLVALAGHGVQFEKDDDAYYCPFDCSIREAKRDDRPVFDGNGTPILEPDPQTCVRLTDIVQRFRTSPAGRRILLADCCRSDPTTGRGRSVGTSIKTDRLPPNTAILLSCQHGQRSWEDQKWGHGAFFYHVIQGIRTGEAAVAGSVGTGSLSTYLSRKVPPDVTQVIGKGAQQKPHPIANDDIDLGLIVKSVSARPLDEVEPPFTRMPVRFNKDAAQKVRAWYARRQRVEPVFEAAGMSLLLIPPGEVQTGSQERMEDLRKIFVEESVESLSRVSKSQIVPIRSGFYIGRTEVTVAQFRQFVKETEYKTDQERKQIAANPTGAKSDEDDAPWHKADQDGGDDTHPVRRVTCNDALEFCKWLSRKTGKRCRLPTLDEWEYVCRAGTQTRYWTGDDPDSLVRGANVPDLVSLRQEQGSKNDGYAGLAPVGSFEANNFGVYDTHGNVWEYCTEGGKGAEEIAIRGGCFL